MCQYWWELTYHPENGRDLSIRICRLGGNIGYTLGVYFYLNGWGGSVDGFISSLMCGHIIKWEYLRVFSMPPPGGRQIKHVEKIKGINARRELSSEVI